jgi:hypothetical protein
MQRFNKSIDELGRCRDGLRAERSECESRQEQEISLFSTASTPALGPTQLPIQWIPRLSEKTCPSATFVHHKIPHDQTRVWTRAAAGGSRRLTAWAMARPNMEVTTRDGKRSSLTYLNLIPTGSCLTTLLTALISLRATTTCLPTWRSASVITRS